MCTCTCYSYLLVPTPPGSITIGHRTNASLHLSWATPALMEGAPHISYLVTYQPEDGEVLNETTTTNSTELSLLSSGTSYNIALKTVGAQNLLSSAVHNSAFTRKYNRKKPEDIEMSPLLGVINLILFAIFVEQAIILSGQHLRTLNCI